MCVKPPASFRFLPEIAEILSRNCNPLFPGPLVIVLSLDFQKILFGIGIRPCADFLPGRLASSVLGEHPDIFSVEIDAVISQKAFAAILKNAVAAVQRVT